MTLTERFDLPAAVGDSAIFGTPYQTPDGATIITVARPGLFRTGLRPLGVVVVQGGESKWHPAMDETRIATLGVITGLIAATLGTLAVVRRPPWPDMRIEQIVRR
ncbi:hypothetical protein ABIA39_007982 [Nocardia sp. GAS34]|uniref:hypothetical protein n=1 Tax=unclassified Nocardia TaxID=2637762 RepID=UPI003D1CA266